MNEYDYLAIDKVITLAKESGLKYRRGDFESAFNKGDKKVLLNEVFDYDNEVLIALWYDFERCGNALKKLRNNFLRYANCRVAKTGVFFTFHKNELIAKNNTEDNEKRELVIRRIQKLLALSDKERNPNEAEAIAASVKAQKLLAKYHLDIVEVTGGEKKEGEDIKNLVIEVGKGKQWKYYLAQVIAKNYCCKEYQIGTEKFVFVGYESDALIARQVFFYLFNVGNKLANKYVQQQKKQGIVDTSGLYNSFCVGFVDGVEKELDKNCKALMLVVSSEVTEKFERLTSTAKVRNKCMNVNDLHAYNNGILEGKRALNSRYIKG